MTERFPIHISDVAGADDRRELEERLNAFNVESTGDRDARQRSCFVRDVEGVLRRQPQPRPELDAAAGHHSMGRPLDPTKVGDRLDRLYRAAWALCGSREDAEDLVQETYARVLARPRLLRNEDDLGYLLRALRNTFLTQKRTESRRLRPDPLPDQLDIVADPRARQPEAALEASELYAAVAELPDDYRDVLVAVDITGLSYKEAARALRIPTGTVMSRLYRARQQVVRRIDGGSA